MPKPYILLALTLALCACSRSDSPATGNASELHANGLRPAIELAENPATVPTPAPELQRVAQKAASEARAKSNDKPRPNAAPDRAQRARAGTARRWDQFQTAIQRCVTVAVSAREHCLAEARDAYRSAHLDCAALPGRERKECVKYGKLWADTATDVPAADTHDEELAEVPDAADGTSPGESAGNSAPQAQDAARTASDDTKTD